MVERVPVGLSSLSLGFAFCSILSEGARAVAAGMPAGLRDLTSNFTRSDIGEAGIRAVAERVRLLAQLISLSLNFTDCNIGIEGVLAVAQGVPTGLSSWEPSRIASDSTGTKLVVTTGDAKLSRSSFFPSPRGLVL